MMKQHYYLSLQYSAIQKTVLRHERLWSIAGISNILSWMNEIEMPRIAREHAGEPIVAGGGKFTARFPGKTQAQDARQECMDLVSTTLPMLEFQVSQIYPSDTFQSLKNDDGRNRVITELGEQKRRFRGYGVSFNPHLELCSECGEYPVQDHLHREKETKRVCRICKAAFKESREIDKERIATTTLQKVYLAYLREVPDARGKKPATDFNDLFPEAKDTEKSTTDEKRKRMAVWFSDLNNMNDKVPVWLNQQDELKVLETFSQFLNTVVEIIAKALATTFRNHTGDYLPFRLVVAGGDDLCLVMADRDILPFCVNISRTLNEIKRGLPDNHPLSDAWLLKNGTFKEGGRPKPFGFGGSFVVTSIHTPFSHIHRVGEDLMSAAKKHTGREGNSVTWRIMAEEETVTEKLLDFERPIFIEKEDKGKNSLNSLTFNDYVELLKKYQKKISGSHRQQIIALMQREKNPWEVERQLKLLDSGETDKSFAPLLRDRSFRNMDGMLLLGRIATLFELMTISGGDSNE